MIGSDENVADRVRGLEKFEDTFGGGFSFAGSQLHSFSLSPNNVAEVDVVIFDDLDEEDPDKQYLVRFIIPNGAMEIDYCENRFIEEVVIEKESDTESLTVFFDGSDIAISGKTLYIDFDELEDF